MGIHKVQTSVLSSIDHFVGFFANLHLYFKKFFAVPALKRYNFCLTYY